MFDLTLFPLSLDAGQERHELPGLFVATAPRNTARMRSQDILILFLTLTTPSGETASWTPTQEQELLNRLADTYFKTPGSVTAGLRAVVTRLNDFLLSRNSRAGQSRQVIGILNLAAIHRSILTLAHSGSTHSFFLDKTRAQHFDDGLGLRGLGLSRQVVPRFYQSALADNDILLFCVNPPQAWSQRLGSTQNLTLDHLRRRLLGDAGVQLQAVVVQFLPGRGQVTYWKPPVSRPQTSQIPSPDLVSPSLEHQRPFSGGQSAAQVRQDVGAGTGQEFHEGHGLVVEQTGDSETTENPSGPQPAEAEYPEAVQLADAANSAETTIPLGDDHLEEVGQGFSGQPDSLTYTLGAEPIEAGSQALDSKMPADEPGGIRLSRAVKVDANREGASGLPDRRSQVRLIKPAENPVIPPSAPGPARPAGPPPSEVLRRNLAPAWRRGSAARVRVSGAFTNLFSKLFPQRSEPLINLSPSMMLMIAIIVPILIGTAGAVVYFRLGRAERFDTLFLRAQQYAAQASQLSDPVQQREGWNRVLEMVDEAEKYGSSTEAAELARTAQMTLDQLEGYVRLDFRPASGVGFEQDVNITRILAKLNQVYLLDSSQGRILSMTRITTGGYEINPFFNCGPGKAGGTYIGPLIDLAELPVNNDLNAEVLGIDAGGNLVYCASNKTGFDSRTLIPPDSGWGEIRGIVTYNDTLYVLDPKFNAVYWYSGQRGLYADSPHLYFDENIPQMADVIDLAVDQEFLYLLHADGEMTICSSGGVSYGATRCTDPAPYGDGRAGYESSPLVFPGANFTQIQTTEPPDPSLFALDNQNTSIYHLSQRRLNLQRQYRPLVDSDFPVPNRMPTAFAVSPNRRALLAFGNQVFFAPLP